jgi:hypothetical protein
MMIDTRHGNPISGAGGGVQKTMSGQMPTAAGRKIC